jgi:hypothetical protein
MVIALLHVRVAALSVFVANVKDDATTRAEVPKGVSVFPTLLMPETENVVVPE